MGPASRKRHQEKMAAQMEARQAKKAARTAKELGGKTHADVPAKPAAPVAAPVVTEDDLLAFQSAHFGDDTKPDNWFVDAETALNVQPTWEEDEDLGFYSDGAKRTLTDEQIEMFRHSEIEQLLRERRLLEDEEDYQNRASRGIQGDVERSPSSASGRSSLEGDLCDLAKPAARSVTRPSPTRKPSQSSRSESSKSTGNQGTWKRQRKTEVPYDQRHKRRWEDFIEDNDPIEGSMTFRRNVRELDDRQEEPIIMDY
ncbi:hypothetical protein KC332_g4620 [Hortaea werneckii]|uniref:Uncharacterized protein n=2 Tax=Hortaea werneckii TaxID=91943 RepID=A0A3M7H7Z8_HORWE|nr:hypothetical protein KC358_g11887 [Hortaea werneckii]OTA33762.1 hypothetical protein BTJ68_07033 [Hortaea werneckii EXF-2000]KAI6851426.1 hypothetical protein KC350_g1660 [Hortaea werneckii]KAI6941280.1 hypothetical protein KC341_g2975 [Hortaea werneckii]KAI6948866.1 hypothetical protein KC348_g1714 [Hortaea werneckii]